MPGQPVGPVPAVPLFEALEARLLLAGELVISEFMADNNQTLKDKDGAYCDWIEIHNTSVSPVNLLGYYLTDSDSYLARWQFPAVIVPGNGYLVVFASDKNITSGPELHTNFKLGADGEYLALVEPDGRTIAYEHAPHYPQQFPDISYGIGQSLLVKTLLGPAAPAAAYVPAQGGLGLSWTGYGFDDSSWALRGTSGVGFDATVPGWAVRTYLANSSLSNLTQAESVISTPANRRDQTDHGETAPYLNYYNNGADAHFNNGRNIPGVSPAYSYVANLAMEATGWITVAQAGVYTFGASSDDGFSLTISGATTTWKYNASTMTVGDNRIDFQGTRSAVDTWGAFNFPAAGAYPVRLVWFQGAGTAEVEVFAAPGERQDHLFNYTDYRLVGDAAGGGLAVKSLPVLPSGLTTYESLIGTNIETAMYKANPSAYLRFPFTLADLSAYNSLALKMKYDDGFVAYLNGVEVARRNAPETVTWNSPAAAERSKADALKYEEIDLTPRLGLLRTGANVLAIQGLNYGASNSDFLVLPELIDTDILNWGLHYFTTATPGQPNLSAYYAYVADTKFDFDRGFYDAPFDLAITTATPGATLRYTLDNSAPTETTGTVYTGPIRITKTTVLRAAAFKAGYEPSNVDTQTYIFLDDVIRQPANPAGYPASWGYYQGNPFPADYGVDPNVVNDPLYSGTIKNDLKAIPTLSIVTSIDDMFGPGGIYSNTMVDGLEVPASVELINPDGTKGFQVNAGIRIYGGWGRHVEYGKHSFRLFFREEYGAAKLDYDLFGNGATTSLDTIILRAGFNDSYVGAGGSAQFTVDEWSRRTQLDMGWPSAHGTYVHLYVDGLYWGLYNPAERPDESFMEAYFGADKDEYDVIHNGSSFNIIQGDRVAWDQMFNLANTGYTQSGHAFNANALASDAAYQAIQQYLNVPGLIDYVLLNFYGTNWDWDHHNWYAARRRAPGAQYQFFVWDGEGNLSSVNGNIDSTNKSGNPTRLFQQLRANADFRQLLIDRIYKAYFNGGPLTPEAARARYAALAAEIDRAVVGESARWGDFKGEPPLTRDRNWVPRRDSQLNTYFPKRSGIELTNLRNAGLYLPLSAGAEAPLFGQNGGNIEPGFGLTMSNPNAGGTIYYTLDGSDPRLPGGGTSPNASIYSGAVTLNDSRMVRARVKNGNAWSAIHDVVFLTPTPPPLRITELLYHPANPGPGSPYSAEDFEFIEVKNIGEATLDIGGMRLADGVEFTFPSMVLAGGAYTVAVSNLPAFQSRYGKEGISVAGQYGGNLENAGERILLEGKFGEPILDFTYSPKWHPASDGAGYAMTIVDPMADRATWGAKASWTLSNLFGGSPGGDNMGRTPGAIAINELLAHTDADARMDWVELKNTTDEPIDIGGWYLSDSMNDLKKYQIAPGTTLWPGQLLLLTQRDHFGNPADSGCLTPFAFSEYGEMVWLVSADADGNLMGYREAQEFGASDREVAFTRHVTSTGAVEFAAESRNTPLEENASPKIGPVVINEVMYHPAGDTDEFFELHNITDAAVPLYDTLRPDNTWKIDCAVTYTFASGLSIPAYGYLLVVNTDPDAFRAKYGVPPDVQIMGPYTGALNNAGEDVRLYKPGDPDPLPPYPVPYYVVDHVAYRPAAPWPAQADGYGPSVQRASPAAHGNDPVNWNAGPEEGTPGRANSSEDVTPPRVAGVSISDGDPIHVTVEFNEAVDPVTALAAANYAIPGLAIAGVSAGPNDHGVVLTTAPMTNATNYTVTATHVKNAAGIEIGAVNHAQFGYWGAGGGLWGRYYQYPPGGVDWATVKMTRLDPTINFDWGTGSPDPSIPMSDLFSIRWTGKIKALYSELYTFYTVSDAGVRLWVNNQLVIDHWTAHTATEKSGTIALQAGQKHDIKIEYYEDSGMASLRLFWSSLSTPRQIVPSSLLFSSANPPVSLPDSYGVLAGASLVIGPAEGVLANDSDPNGYPLTARRYRRASHGSAAVNADGSFTYTPDAGYVGQDTFSYYANNGTVDGNEAVVTLLVDTPPVVTGITVNERADRSVSSIEARGTGIQTIEVAFNKAVLFVPDDLLLEKVLIDGDSETVVETIPPCSVLGVGTPFMQIVLFENAAIDSWLKVTLKGNGTLRGAAGLNLPLDGEPQADGSGRLFIFSSANLPTGNGSPGGDACFYVGSLRGDFCQAGGAPGGDGRMTAEDFDAFLARFQDGDNETDLCGTGFNASGPDGLVTPWDMDRFLSLYAQSVSGNRRLPSLPNPGPPPAGEAGPLAQGSPEPVALAQAPSLTTPGPASLAEAGSAPLAPADGLQIADCRLQIGKEALFPLFQSAICNPSTGVVQEPATPVGVPLAWEGQQPRAAAPEAVLSPDGGVELQIADCRLQITDWQGGAFSSFSICNMQSAICNRNRESGTSGQAGSPQDNRLTDLEASRVYVLATTDSAEAPENLNGVHQEPFWGPRCRAAWKQPTFFADIVCPTAKSALLYVWEECL